MGGQVSGKDVTMNGRQLQLQNGKCITKCCGPTTNSMRKNVAANVEAFRKKCCFNKFTTEVESAFPRFSRCVEGAKVADRTQTALDECSRRHRFALNSISHFSISARFQGQHNFEKKIAVEIPLRIPHHSTPKMFLLNVSTDFILCGSVRICVDNEKSPQTKRR